MSMPSSRILGFLFGFSIVVVSAFKMSVADIDSLSISANSMCDSVRMSVQKWYLELPQLGALKTAVSAFAELIWEMGVSLAYPVCISFVQWWRHMWSYWISRLERSFVDHSSLRLWKY